MSYATMQDVSFALVTDCELPDRPRRHLEPELPKEEPDRSHRATPGSDQAQGSIDASRA